MRHELKSVPSPPGPLQEEPAGASRPAPPAAKASLLGSRGRPAIDGEFVKVCGIPRKWETGNLSKKSWAFIRVLNMNPHIVGVIGPGLLNQVPTLTDVA